MIARSIALIELLSYGWTVSSRASGALIVAICRSGVIVAVVVDVDAVQQRRAGAPGAHGLELLARRLHGLVHVLARVLKEFVDHVVTSVPTRSPEIIRLMLESSAMLKTWMLQVVLHAQRERRRSPSP